MTTPSRPLLERPLVRAAIALPLLALLGLAAFFAIVVRNDGGGSELIAVDRAPTPAATAEREPGIGPLDDRGPVIGQPAPDFALRDLGGNVVRLSDLRGQIVFINFWATWCRPCKKELPAIQKIYDEKRDDGLVVLAVNREDPRDVAAGYWSDAGLTMPVLLDSHKDVFDQYRLRGLPDSFFIGRDGNVAALQYGSMTEGRMRDKLADAGLP